MDDSGIGGWSNMLCARFLVASEQIAGSGPVAAALRSAGHLTESEEEEGDEEERRRAPRRYTGISMLVQNCLYTQHAMNGYPVFPWLMMCHGLWHKDRYLPF